MNSTMLTMQRFQQAAEKAGVLSEIVTDKVDPRGKKSSVTLVVVGEAPEPVRLTVSGRGELRVSMANVVQAFTKVGVKPALATAACG